MLTTFDLFRQVEETKEWFCYMCEEGVGILKKQEDWSDKLHVLYSTGFEEEYVSAYMLVYYSFWFNL